MAGEYGLCEECQVYPASMGCIDCRKKICAPCTFEDHHRDHTTLPLGWLTKEVQLLEGYRVVQITARRT